MADAYGTFPIEQISSEHNISTMVSIIQMPTIVNNMTVTMSHPIKIIFCAGSSGWSLLTEVGKYINVVYASSAQWVRMTWTSEVLLTYTMRYEGEYAPTFIVYADIPVSDTFTYTVNTP